MATIRSMLLLLALSFASGWSVSNPMALLSYASESVSNASGAITDYIKDVVSEEDAKATSEDVKEVSSGSVSLSATSLQG